MSHPCGDCGATGVEMFMTCTPRCVDKRACALRCKLRDLRAATETVAQHATATGDLYAAADKEACALRTKLHVLRAAVGAVAQHATATGDLYVAAELRKACRESDR